MIQSEAAVRSCVSPPSGLVGWWAWENNGNDIADADTATLFGSPSFVAGKVGQALQLAGNPQQAIAPATPTLNVGAGNGFTVEAWINPDDVSSAQPIIEWNGGASSPFFFDSDQGIGVHLWKAVAQDGGGTGSLYINLREFNNTNHVYSTPTNVIVAGTWQHVAFTYDKTTNNGTLTVYVNGAVARQATNVGVFTPQTTYPLNFGSRTQQSTNFYSGGLDEVGVYNRALSAAEIAAIYNADSSGKCRNNGLAATIAVSSTPNPSVVGQQVTFTATVTGAGTPTGTVQFKDSGNNIGSPATLNGSGVATFATSSLTAGTHRITAQYSGDSNFATSAALLPGGQIVGCASPADLVASYSAEGNRNDNAGPTFEDGTAFGTPRFVLGKVGQAFDFTNNNSVRLGSPTPLKMASALTVEAWIRPVAGSSGQTYGIISRWASSYALQLVYQNGALNLRGEVQTTGGILVADVAGSIPLNTWTHVAMTFNASTSTVAFYINGLLISSPSAFSGNLINVDANVYIGEKAGSNFFIGQIDEVGIFNRALLASEVASVYNAGTAGKCKAYDANLSNLTLSAGTLTPAFSAGTTSYTASVANSVSSITVTPTAVDSNTRITVNGTLVSSGAPSGAINLAVGNNTITIATTAQDGVTTKQYSVVVNRAAPAGGSNADLSNLTLSAGTLSPAFSSNTTSYTLSVPNSTTSTTVTPTVADSNATVKVNGQTVASGTASSSIALNPGNNTINTVVTAQDGTTTKTYTVTVTRAKTPSTTAVTSSLNPSNFGQQVTFTATVTGSGSTPTGTVQFKSDGTNIGSPATLNGSGVATVATSSLSVGTHTITADYSGDNNFLTSTGTLSGGQVVAGACISAPANLVAWYAAENNFNDIQGSTFENGSISGSGITFVAGMVGQAFNFNGSGFVTMGTPAPLVITGNQVTLDGWINPTVADSTTRIYFGRSASSQNDYLLLANNGVLSGSIKTAGGETFVNGPAQLPANTWSHIALTYDGSIIKVFLNGAVVASAAKTGNIVSSGAAFVIGGRTGGTNNFSGKIDEVEVFNRALSDSEIASLYNAGSAGKCKLGLLQFSSATYNVGEGGGTATITVKRTDGSVGAASVHYATSDGSATAGSDYTATSGDLAWADGDTADKTVQIAIADETAHELNETFNVTLSSPTNAQLGSPTTTTVTISANDNAPIVTNTNDNGAGSLRQAVSDALAGDTITFNISGSGPFTITLTSGELAIAKNVTISGLGASQLIVSGNNSSRIFNIASGVVNISDLTVTAGLVPGGSGGGLLIASGTVTLTGMSIRNNGAASGAGIAGNGGTININNSSITSNIATGAGGGIISSANFVITNTAIGAVGQGNKALIAGGFYSNTGSSLTMNGGSLSGNEANGIVGNPTGVGGGIYAPTGTVIFTGVDITFNSVTRQPGGLGFGGGIYRNGPSSVTVNLCRFFGNTAQDAGAAIHNGHNAAGSNINAVNNWWGCDGLPNTGSCQTVAVSGVATITSNPRIDLVLTAVPSSIGAGGTSTLTADVSMNSSGATINPVVMNGLPVTFAGGAFGSVAPTTVNIASLQASSTFTAGASGGSSIATAQVDNAPGATATVTITPTVTSSATNLTANATSMTISGTGFSTTPANNTVTFSGGATGTVTAATNTQLTVSSLSGLVAGALNASVTVNSVSSGSAVQVATVTPVVTQNTANISSAASSLTINGFGFSSTPANNTVVFSSGGGNVTAASSTSLTITFTSAPSGGALTAVVTSNSASSGSPVQVATVTLPVFTIDDVSHNEGDSGTTSYVFTVTKTGSTGLSASVSFATVNGTATIVDGDYQSNSGSLTFLPADASKAITVLVNGDTTNEADETFTVHLSGASNATISDADGVGTILNDDNPPTISDIADTSTDEDTATGAIAFTVGDADTPAGSLTVSGSSSDTTLVPNANIVFGGSGANRTVTITPATNQNGAATITVTVSDGTHTASDTFVLTVNAVNDAPSFTKGQDQGADKNAGAQSVPNWATNISPGPPDETGQTVAFLILNNSNPGLFAAGPAIGSTGTLTYTPATNATGTATITIALKDNGGIANSGQDTSASQNFSITIYTPAQTWQRSYFTEAELADPSISGPLADPNGNGLPNLLEYAFHLDPKGQTTENRPTITRDATYFSFIYTKNLAATDLTYTIEQSTDMVTWTPVSPTNVILSDDGTTQRIQAEVPHNGAPRMSLRLRVTLN